MITRCRFHWPEAWWPNLHAINITKGCEFNCPYCWAASLANRFPHMMPSSGRWGSPDLKTYDLERLGSEALHLPHPSTILLSSTCDPYQGNLKYLTTRSILQILASPQDRPYRIVILTKSAAVAGDLDVLKALNAEVGFTIPPWEPQSDAPPMRERIVALRDLHKVGLRTFASVEPWWPTEGWEKLAYLTDLLFQHANRIILGSLNKSGRPVNPHFYRAELPKLMEWLDNKGKLEGVDYFIKPELRALLEK